MERETIRIAFIGGRRFLWKGLIAVFVAAAVNFAFAKQILHFLLRTTNVKVYYLNLPEAFFSSVELALYAGIFTVIPVLFFLVWYEFQPVLPMSRRAGLAFVFFAIVLFYLGGVFCSLIVLPSGIAFLLSFGTDTIRPLISIDRFVTFCTAMVFAFSITFEIPIILLLLGKTGILHSRTLVKTRRFAVLFIAIGSAIITPTPDVYNMMLLALPTYILFEIGIFLMKMSERKKRNVPAELLGE